MKLAITRRPFLYFPLASHFEQLYHVTRRLTYQDTTVETLAGAALQTLGTDTGTYRQHRPGAARRAASLIAELL